MKKFGLILMVVVWFPLLGAYAFAGAPGDGAATKHTFPQFVDGRFADGTFYTSTLMISNPDEARSVGCTILFRGFRPTVKDSSGNVTSADAFTMDFEAGQGDILTTTGLAEFRSGYVTLNCDQPVDASVLYALHAPSGGILSEAAVLSSGQGTRSQLVVDHRAGARLGVAINNDSDVPASVQIRASGYSEPVISTQTITIPARSTVSRFVDEVVPLPPNFVGQIFVESGAKITVMGLRFTGTAFTTIPASVRVP